MGFTIWKKSCEGLTTAPVVLKNFLDVVSNSSGYYIFDTVSFVITLARCQDGAGIKLSLVSKRECKPSTDSFRNCHRFYIPLFHHCAAKITLVGKNGSQVAKWLHLDLQLPVPGWQSSPLIEFQEARNLCLFSEADLSIFAVDGNFQAGNICTTTVEVFCRIEFKMCVNPFTCFDYPSSCYITFNHPTESSSSLSLVAARKSYPNDVNFQVGADDDVETIGACSHILAARSPIFLKAFFEADMVEKRTKTITRSDVQPAVMKKFLEIAQANIIPEAKMNLDVSQVVKILELGHMYQVEEVIEFCKMLIMCYDNEKFNVDDVDAIRQLGKSCNIPEFIIRCFQWLKWQRKTSKSNEVTDAFIRNAGFEFAEEILHYDLQCD